MICCKAKEKLYSRCCNGDTAECNFACTTCGKYLRRSSKNWNYSSMEKLTGAVSAKTLPDDKKWCYVTHIVFAGIRPGDNVYEVKLLLAPQVDISSVKITVKNKNLRVTINRPLGDMAKSLPPLIYENVSLTEMIKRSTKHCENFLIPENIDGDKVRAIIDNKSRSLVLTAPTLKPCKALKSRFSMTFDN